VGRGLADVVAPGVDIVVVVEGALHRFQSVVPQQGTAQVDAVLEECRGDPVALQQHRRRSQPPGCLHEFLLAPQEAPRGVRAADALAADLCVHGQLGGPFAIGQRIQQRRSIDRPQDRSGIAIAIDRNSNSNIR